MKIIDAHVHVGEWDNPDFFSRALGVQELFDKYRKWGIECAVIMPTDRGNNGEILESLKRYPGNKYMFAPWAKPLDEGLIDLCQRNIGCISALKFHPSLDKTRLTDKKYEKYLDYARQKNLPVIVHCGRWEEMAGYRFALEVAADKGNLKVLLSHMGGDTPRLAFGAMETVKKNGLGNVYFDTAGFREYWVIEQGVMDLGAERFLFASDFPLGHPVSAISLIENMEIRQDQKEKILGGNAAKLFDQGRF